MKKQAKHIAAGGVVAPATLGIVTVAANAIQEAANLQLQGIALAIYLAAFLLASALVVHGQLRLEAQRLLSELSTGNLDLADILGSLGGLFGADVAGASPPTDTPSPPPPAAPTALPPIPPAP